MNNLKLVFVIVGFVLKDMELWALKLLWNIMLKHWIICNQIINSSKKSHIFFSSGNIGSFSRDYRIQWRQASSFYFFNDITLGQGHLTAGLKITCVVIFYFKESWITWNTFGNIFIFFFFWHLVRAGFTLQLISLIFKILHLIKFFQGFEPHFKFLGFYYFC